MLTRLAQQNIDFAQRPGVPHYYLLAVETTGGPGTHTVMETTSGVDASWSGLELTHNRSVMLRLVVR